MVMELQYPPTIKEPALWKNLFWFSLPSIIPKPAERMI